MLFCGNLIALERALGSGGGNEEDGNGVVASVSKAFLDLDDAAKQVCRTYEAYSLLPKP